MDTRTAKARAVNAQVAARQVGQQAADGQVKELAKAVESLAASFAEMCIALAKQKSR